MSSPESAFQIEAQKRGTPQTSKQYLDYVSNLVESSFKKAHFPRGKAKYHLLTLLLRSLRRNLEKHPDWTSEQLATLPISKSLIGHSQADMTPLSQKELALLKDYPEKNADMISLSQALDFHRLSTSSKGPTRSSQRIFLETNPAELTKQAIQFINDLWVRMNNKNQNKPENKAKRDAVHAIIHSLHFVEFQSIRALCEFRADENSKNFLQVLMMHRDPSKQNSDAPTTAFKEFCKLFHLRDHLTEEEIQEILSDVVVKRENIRSQ